MTDQTENKVQEKLIQIHQAPNFHQSPIFQYSIPRFSDTHDATLGIRHHFGIPNQLISEDHVEQQELRLQRFASNSNQYLLTARLWNKNNLVIRYFVKVWYGNEEVAAVTNKRAVVDAEASLVLCDFDLDEDEFGRMGEGNGDLKIFLNLLVTNEVVTEEVGFHDEENVGDVTGGREMVGANPILRVTVASAITLGLASFIQLFRRRL